MNENLDENEREKLRKTLGIELKTDPDTKLNDTSGKELIDASFKELRDERIKNVTHIPKIPADQKWLYTILVDQGKTLNTIKNWVTYFGILSVISLSIGVIYFLIIIVGLLSPR